MNLSTVLRLDPEDPEEQALLADVQGNVFSSHGREFANHILLRFSEDGQDDARAFIRAARQHVTTASEQFAQAVQYKQDPAEQHTFYGLGVSAECCRWLGIDDALLPTDAAFREGMSRRHASIGDSAASSGWETHLKAPHVIVIVADDRPPSLASATDEMLGALTHPDRYRAVVESGGWMRRPAGDHDAPRIEHFGFVEGISNPRYLPLPAGTAPGTHWDDETPIQQVLVTCGPAASKRFGSLLVFRKLEQDVRRFWQLEQQLDAAVVAAHGSPGRAAAMAMGRFRDGTPIAERRAPGGPGAAHNDFRPRVTEFLSGVGSRCPMHAHIRRANPRGELDIPHASTDHGAGYARPGYKPITRRGIPYGTRADDPCDPSVSPEDRPASGVGMLFMSVHGDIAAQFEYVNRYWLGGTLSYGTVDRNVVDPIATDVPNARQHWPVEWADSSKGTVPFAFTDCVTLRGGEYFFLPPKSFLELI